MPSTSSVEHTGSAGNVPNEPKTAEPLDIPAIPQDEASSNVPQVAAGAKEPPASNLERPANVPNMPGTVNAGSQEDLSKASRSTFVASSESAPASQEAVEKLLSQELSESNTPIHSFNPDDSPEEKAKKAIIAAGTVISNNPLLTGAAEGLISDVDLGTSEAPSQSLKRSSTTITNRSVNSVLSSLPPAIIGWKECSEKSLESHAEQEWRNALCLVTIVLSTYTLVSFGFGFGWCVIVLFFVAQYYVNSVKRFRRNVRDDINRQLAIDKVIKDAESTEWLNTFLSKFWLIYEPVLSATIVGIADGILAASAPGFLDSLRLSEFTLGTTAPRVESVKSFVSDEADAVEMEWDVSFTDNHEDITPRQLKNKTNPKVVLEVRVGKGFVGAGMPILVENIAFSGRMRIKLKLGSNFPHMQAVDLSFVEIPSIDYVLKPIGGETFGFDIAHIPGLSSFIREQIHAVLGPMMYSPNVFTLDLEQIISGIDTEAAIGILRIHIRHARNLKNVEVLGLSDPYVRLHIGNRAELGRTTVKENTLNPNWDETFFVLAHNLSETLTLEIFDKEEIKKDRSLGTATFNLVSLLDEPVQDNVIAKVIREGGKERGEVCFDITYYPVVEPIVEEDGTTTQIESNHGILKIFVHQAKDLDNRANTRLNPYSVVKLKGTKILTTKILKRKANPAWEDPVELFISDKSKATFTFEVMDERGLAVDPVLGSFTISLDEALQRMAEQNQWFTLNGHATGKVRLSFVWKPIEMKDNIIPPGHLAPPKGVVRLDLVGAQNLKNVEKIGKSDPYVVVSISGKPISKTEVIDNNLNPIWNETHYVGIRSAREIIYLDVYDFDKVGKDRLLGSTSIPVSQLLGEQIREHQWGPGSPQDLRLKLNLEGKEKGQIHLKASFNPINELVPRRKVSESPSELGGAQDSLTEATGQAASVDYTRYSTGLLSVLVCHTTGMRQPLDSVYAEVLLNNNEYSVVHRTKTKKRAQNPNFDEECEVFIQESQFARISVYLREMDDDRSIVARKTIELSTILAQMSDPNHSPDEGFWYEFENTDGKLLLKFQFYPVEIQIDESQSWINKGLVTVRILKAQGLRAADSSGTSDPFVLVKLNKDKVHKTKVIKKTLSPVFGEEFTAPVHARNIDSLIFEVFDWNQVQSYERLGYLQINTKDLEPLTWIQGDYPLSDGSGTLSLKLMFKPEHVGRMATDRKQTFQEVTKNAIGKGVGGATKVVGGTIGGIGKGVGKGVGGLFGLKKKSSDRGSIAAPAANSNMPLEAYSTRSSISSSTSASTNMPNMPNMPGSPDAPPSPQASITTPETQSPIPEQDAPSINESLTNSPSMQEDMADDRSGPHESQSELSVPQSPGIDMANTRLSISNLDDVSVISGDSSALDQYSDEKCGEPGFLTVDILQGKELPAVDSNGLSDPYVRVRWGRKAVYKTKIIKKTLEPKWQESFTIPVDGSPVRLNFLVRDHNMLQDVDLGEYETNIWDHIDLTNSQPAEGVWVDLQKATKGKILLKFTFSERNSPGSSEMANSLSGSTKKRLDLSTFKRK
ncbi:hypothetical protein K493DRAFT_342190 [Basidiobolus meristosporus CBS 931.73]|uniref:Tricalbin n=1 Tax=Basidiobolus meristosporus CBS 931.73 TaxID=1314790 RepID=A0A1Y1X9Q3_9FUNG|nr:hypothetical protein K493DRAFT_342190 [Basidiobolus meristosporus CBS 931.73]|eukprot:ORX82449.1 hypothetical protein K493DRAFT_342190 [Basidiobolus meristosporus CBS 931.73]